ncbi:ferric reductase like transmembrane component-domain-containing protein [Nemania abortiva]|nr:ferric reductase like transmembrane component-domain-containing protein [Nemania abortiva]
MMSMSGIPSGSSTSDLPLSDPRCNSDECAAFKAAHVASQAAVSYYHQYDYGHYTTWYYLAVIGVCAFSYACCIYRDRCSSIEATASSPIRKLQAAGRYVQYKHIRGTGAAFCHLPSLAVIIFLAITSLYLLLLTFLVHPYYRERRGFGSPPISIRTGLMAQALTPLIVALAGKVNVVTFLTGISHEKLNILHRWASYMCLFLSIVHTVPFIVQPLRDGGYKALRAQYYKPGGYEFTGTPPLGILVGLVVLSFPWIRNRWYNFFYRVHIPMYITYLGLMFWHAGNEGDSWAYLWATLALWLASVLTRLFFKWQTFSFSRPKLARFAATAIKSEGGLTQLTVFATLGFQWTPGQFCYLRIPNLSILQNHPYTIVNVPERRTADVDKQSGCNPMIFYIRAHHGLTGALLESVDGENGRSMTVHVDGPYGGVVERTLSSYDSLIFVAGGSGISACLPHILFAAQNIRAGNSKAKQVHLVWMVRKPEHLRWITKELIEVVGDASWLRYQFYITEKPAADQPEHAQLSSGALRPSEKLSVVGRSTTTAAFGEGVVNYGRPVLAELLWPLLTERRIVILGCGPKSLTVDLSNAAASAQRKVIVGDADTIKLHTEMFHW